MPDTPPRTPPYSEATVDLVAAAIAAARDDDVFTEVEWNGSHWDSLRDAYRADARASLDALAERGLLLPEGSESRTERHYSPAHDGLVERRVITTAWSPVPPEPEAA